MDKSRQTAFKLWLYDINNSEYVKEHVELSPSYIVFKENKVSRVNIIANVVMKFENQDKSYSYLTLDDGSDTIRVKCWKADVKILDDINVGDTILTIGRIRKFNDEVYVTPEILKKFSYEWSLVRKLELEKLYGKRGVVKPKEQKQESFDYSNIGEESVEDVPNESNRQKLLSLIEKHDSEDGVDIKVILDQINIKKEEANKIIEDLLKEGEIFQLKGEKLKIIN